MKNANLSICNETIHPGEQVSLALPLPELFSCAPMYMPIKIIHGKEAGPCLLVTAAMHGNELNGTEIINQLLRSSLLKRLKGTLIAVPIMNVYGFINKSRTLPGGTLLNNSFPGSAQGSHAARLAHIFCEEVFRLADFCIDLQTGWLNYSNLPQIFVSHDIPKELELAHSFAAPVISQVTVSPGSLRAHANQTKTPYLIYEAGEAMRFDKSSISIGTKGLINVMRHIGMLPSSNKVGSATKQQCFVTHDKHWVRSPTSGISRTNVKLGQRVAKGERLTTIQDPFGAGTDITVEAPFDSIVVSINNLPLVYEGNALYQLASFERLSLAASHLEDWVDESSDNLPGL